MRILIVHNHYGNYAVGGEAMVMQAEAELLRAHGHEVVTYERTNAELDQRSLPRRVQAFLRMGWSREGYRCAAEAIDRARPDVMHVHNYKFLLTPSIFGAACDRGVATVLTLHNYRMACPAGQFLHNGRACEDCLDGFAYRMLWRRCRSRNIGRNLSEFYLYWCTRRRGLLARWVDAYIALSEFARQKFVQAGLPAEKVHVKPNFLADPLQNGVECHEGQGAIFAGRLSKEKGAEQLLAAWRDIAYPLTIVGDGGLRSSLQAMASAQVEFAGLLPRAATLEAIRRAAFVVFPSICYEGFGMTVLEAMAMGKPVLASDLGPRREMIQDGAHGLLYDAYDAADLARKARRLIGDAHLRRSLGQNARAAYLSRYTPETNYARLMEIYTHARSRSVPACAG